MSDRIVLHINEIRGEMTCTYAFTRLHVTLTLQKVLGGSRIDRNGLAGKLLRIAIRDKTIRRERSGGHHYFFTSTHHTSEQGEG